MMKKSLIATLLASVLVMSAQAKDIVDTAVDAGSFKTLATALGAAGLVETLKGKGPFTVFAPTDEAFAKIPKADLEALLKDKAKLTAVLTYHVFLAKSWQPMSKLAKSRLFKVLISLSRPRAESWLTRLKWSRLTSWPTTV